jgi:hypothetical protein
VCLEHYDLVFNREPERHSACLPRAEKTSERPKLDADSSSPRNSFTILLVCNKKKVQINNEVMKSILLHHILSLKLFYD